MTTTTVHEGFNRHMDTYMEKRLRMEVTGKCRSNQAKSCTLRRFFGLACAFASIGLWLAPGNHWTPEVMLLKTGLTAILCFCTIFALMPRVTITRS